MSDSMDLNQKVVEQKQKLFERWKAKELAYLDEKAYLKDLDDVKDFVSLIHNPSLPKSNARTLVALLGESGHGKSTLINALLNEDNIITASSRRACTSVATEISWNRSNDPSEVYVAEIEFFTEDEWSEEVNQCMNDIQDAFEMDETVTAETSAAFATLQAVYPNIDIKDMVRNSRRDLLDAINISQYLGKPKRIAEKNITNFRKAVRTFTDASNANEDSQILPSLLPLIKVVHVQLKSDILRNGLVLVDLPGMGDTNAARNELAERYVKNANHVLVVARIVRAVTDRTARQLLGEHFQKGLLLSGRYTGSFVTFVATQTDDIAIDETSNSLQQEDTTSHKFMTMMGQRDELKAQLDIYEQQSHSFEYRRKEITRGLKTLKRQLPSSKKRKRVEVDEDQEDLAVGPDTTISPLTNIKTEIAKLESERPNINKQMQNIRNKISSIQRKQDKLRPLILSLCIQERNKWTTHRLRQDFAKGLEDLRDQLRQASSSASINCGNADVSSLDKADLQVFCVSSKGYQHRQNPNKLDMVIEGFNSDNETGIPALRKHLISLSSTRSGIKYHESLQDVEARIQALELWSQNETNLKEVAGEDSANAAETYLQNMEEEMSQIGKGITGCHSQNIQQDITSNLQLAADAATKKAPTIRDGIPNHPRTFKAMCRRGGVHKPRRGGMFDLPETYTAPIMDPLSTLLEKVFLKEAATQFILYKTEISKKIASYKSWLNDACNKRELPPSCRLNLQKCCQLIDMLLTETVKRATKRCKNVPQEIKAFVKIHIKGFLKVLFDKAIMIKCDRKQKVTVRARLQAALNELWKDAKVYHDAIPSIQTIVTENIESISSLFDRAETSIQARLRDALGSSSDGSTLPESAKSKQQLKAFRKRIRTALANLDKSFKKAEETPKISTATGPKSLNSHDHSIQDGDNNRIDGKVNDPVGVKILGGLKQSVRSEGDEIKSHYIVGDNNKGNGSEISDGGHNPLDNQSNTGGAEERTVIKLEHTREIDDAEDSLMIADV